MTVPCADLPRIVDAIRILYRTVETSDLDPDWMDDAFDELDWEHLFPIWPTETIAWKT